MQQQLPEGRDLPEQQQDNTQPQPLRTMTPLTPRMAPTQWQGEGNEWEQPGVGMVQDPRGQWFVYNRFASQSDPPPLPPGLRDESERTGMWSGLARAGQALRRRMIGSAASSPHPPSEPLPPQQASLMQPSMARAMYEWTARTSLISPGPHPPRQGQDQMSNTSSIPQELIMQEVRNQVREAMREKELEMNSLKGQNRELQEALQSSLKALETARRGGEDRGQERSPWAPVELRGKEPEGQGGQGERGRLHDLREHRLRQEQLEGNLPGSGLTRDVGNRGGDPTGLRYGDVGSSGTRAQGADGDEPRRPMMEGERGDPGDPLQVLAQGMRQLQLAYMGKSEKDSDVKGNVDVPAMPEVGTESAVEFSDWVYETEQAVGSLSDQASTWFGACLELARRTYDEYVNATPIERLTLDVVLPEELRAPRWARLEKKVMMLLLGAMTRTAKDDVITHRVRTVPGVLYRMHVLYQPGGASERAAILRQLEGKAMGEGVHDCIAALRKWRRYLQRAEEMGVTIPDASILLKSVELIIERALEVNGDVKFRLSLVKNELQVQSRPTTANVIRFYNHALAELQQSAPSPAAPVESTTQEPASSSSTMSREEARAAEEGQVKALLQEANAMLSKLAKLTPIKVVSDEELEEMTLAMSSLENPRDERAGLLDTGASHSFRVPVNLDEEATAVPVKVELAGGQYITLKQNRAGTLLATKDVEGAVDSTPIIPLGALVQQLGCDLSWTRSRGLIVSHPQFGELRTFVRGNHPMIGETQALALIAQLEDVKLRELENNVAGTYVKMMDIEKAKEWDVCMAKYAQTGQRSHALEALVSGYSPMGPLTPEMAALIAIDVKMDNKSAWNYVKALPIRRSLRETMMEKRWAVRLFAQEGDTEVKALDSGEVIFVDINVNRSKLFNLRGESPAYKALMWAALNGRIEGLFGAVPSNFGEELRTKMMWLWMVTKVVNQSCDLLPPYLAMGGKDNEVFWTSEQWKAFQHEHQLPLTQAIDPNSGNAFLVATNLQLPTERPADGVRLRHSRTWTPVFYQNLVEAIKHWRRFPNGLAISRMIKKMDGPLHSMTEAEKAKWMRHLRNNHLPFEKRCRTCIETSATGRAHRRVIAPSCYVLSLDLCGPFRVKGEYAGARGYKYALIGAYVMPKLSGYKDAPVEEPDPEEEAALEEDDWMEEIPQGEEPLDPKDEAELKKSKERYEELLKGIGDSMEYQVLHYAIPLKTRLMRDVDMAVKTLYLQLRAEGLPVTRVHSDRARELRGADLRAWLLHRDVLPTCGEAQVPQTNGRAEAAVKQAKKRAKTLLMSAGLPRACWPWAMAYGAYQQREFALSRGASVIPFGSPVHVRNKVFGTGDKHDLDSRWKEGIYMGPAPDIRNGHTVRFPEGRYVSSMHLRTRVVDIDKELKLDEVDMDLPSPSRRLRRKSASTRVDTGPGVGGDQDNLPAEDFDPHHDPPGKDADDDGRGVFGEDDEDLEFPVDWVDGPIAVDNLFDDLPAEDFGPHHDPPGPLYEMDAALPSGVPSDDAALPSGVPGRRVTGKSTLKVLRPLSLPEQEAEAVAEVKYQKALNEDHFMDNRDVLTWRSLWTKGCCRSSAVWCRGIVKNASLGCHRDLHNHPGSYNAVYPINEFKGGGIWIHGDPDEDEEVCRKQVKPGLWKDGVLREFGDSRTIYFSPRQWHEVQPHDGDRYVLVAYSPRCYNLRGQDRRQLSELGFNVLKPKEDEGVRMGLFKKGEVEKVEKAALELNEAHQQLFEDLQERAYALRILLEEEQALGEDLKDASAAVKTEVDTITQAVENMIKNVDEKLQQGDADRVRLCALATQVQEEPDYEAMIDAMEGDLQVVHTVPLNQVRPAVDRWDEAIKKELKSLFDTGTLRKISYKEAQALQRDGQLRLVPSKGVHTLKPPDVPGRRLRRRYRLVLCGNHADKEEGYGSLYAGGASIETFRGALTYASFRKWRGASSDISSAFLLADWPKSLSRYAVLPPKFLVDNGYVAQDECWLVEKPLYGLRESPSIWVDKEVWMAFDEKGNERAKGSLVALLVTYVDDLFFLGSTSVVELLDEWVRKEWPCSGLQWADGEDGVRYLGTEVYQRASGAFELKQTGYIEDLLRAHEMTDACPTKLPCPKEWISEDFEAYEEQFNEADLKQGQRAVGELLWLTMRTRPDLQFVVGHMSQWVSKHPKRVEKIGRRVLAYLSGTKEMRLVLGEFGDVDTANKAYETSSSQSSSHHSAHTTTQDAQGSTESTGLTVIAYSDASFAPTGSRSYGASVVTVNGSPIAWKAGRQGMVTLSTMEAELLEATQTAVLTEGLACLLDEFCGRRVERLLRVDNAAATSMLLGGPGSWRTRHLRVRSAHILESVESGQLRVEFVEGLRQLADLGTKSHPKARMWELLRMWGFESLPSEAVQLQVIRAVLLSLVTLALDGAPKAQALEEKEPLKATGVDELVLLVVGCCLLAVLGWEIIKWISKCAWTRAVKGRKAQRLQRMKDLAKAAVENELDRVWDVPQEAFQGRSPDKEVEQAVHGAMTSAMSSAPVLSHARQEGSKRTLSRAGRMISTGTQTDDWERPRDVPEDPYEYLRFPGPFYLTEHGKNVHTRQDCHGFRLASHRVKTIGFCDWCDGAAPLYVRRERRRAARSTLG
ncbi:GIP [Symbiodinium sp. CCMP2592]|nr:GIP [Symbiodinium sp. CCMP2592]